VSAGKAADRDAHVMPTPAYQKKKTKKGQKTKEMKQLGERWKSRR